MRTKPVTGPSSPSFSILKFANASSPTQKKKKTSVPVSLPSLNSNHVKDVRTKDTTSIKIGTEELTIPFE